MSSNEAVLDLIRRLLFDIVGFVQCKARYRPYGAHESLLAMYCVRCKWHFGKHRDNNDEWEHT